MNLIKTPTIDWLFIVVFGVLILWTGGAFATDVDCDKNRTDEIVCASCNIYHEARGEAEDGMEAVAWVMYNRVNDIRFPESYCAVVWEQPYGRPEFSWTDDGKSDLITDKQSWATSVEIATTFVVGSSTSFLNSDDPTMGAIFYHSTGITPTSWWESLIGTIQIGQHLFYTDARFEQVMDVNKTSGLEIGLN